MPPTRHAVQRSGRITAATTRAASVPVSRPENPRLESLRLKKQRSSILDDEDTSPSSLPSVVITRGRKRTSSFGATDCIPSTSASVTAPVPEASEQRPRKKQKRSSSTPATSRPSQVFVQLQSRRRSRSRAGLPATDVEYVTPSRTSARLARRIHSLLNGPSSDIYMHLAGPDGASDLLSEPPAGSVILSAPNETVGSQTVPKPRGRRRKAVDLTDENAKKDLIEEWARMRQSQGTLSLSGVDGSQMQLRDTRKDDESPELEPIAQARSPDAHTMETQGIILDDTLSPRMDSENALSAKKDRNIILTLPSEGGTGHSIAPSVDIEAPPPLIPTPHVGEGSPNGELACVPETTHNPDLWQHPASPQIQSVLRLGEDSAVMKLAISEQAVSLDSLPKDSHSGAISSFDKSSIRLDSDEEFYMLDISEIFTLPWEPVASHLYVPPGLGKLISGMRGQLTIEARARRRAEDLYQAELSRRISAEKMIEDLRAELERKDKHTHPGDLIGTRQEDGSK